MSDLDRIGEAYKVFENLEEIEIKSYPNPWIRFEDIPEDAVEFLHYKAKITNEIIYKGGIMPESYYEIDRLRFGWYWEKFKGFATLRALYELSKQSYTNIQNIRAWINSIEAFIKKAEASEYDVREHAQKEKECPNRECAYLKIVLNVYSERQEAPQSLGLETGVFADCFIILPFLKWKLKSLTDFITANNEKKMINASADGSQEKETKLTHAQIALLYSYTHKQITKNNAQEIAERYGQTSGQKLISTYNRMVNSSTERTSSKFAVRDIEKVIELLSEAGHLERAKDELKEVKKLKNID